MPPQDDLIYDVGAHLGEDSAFYLALGYRVVAIEANPALADALRHRFADAIAAGRYILVQKAIAANGGEVDFYVNETRSVWGTTDAEWAARNAQMGAASHKVSVPATTMSDVVGEHGLPHYMKIDVEGVDQLCVEQLAGFAAPPDYLSVESNKTDWAALLAEFDRLEALGYSRFKVVNQHYHGTGRFTALDGSRVDYAFEPDASGPFGAHLAGPWLSREEALARYRTIFRQYRWFGDGRLLGRILRRLPVVGRVVRRIGWYDTHAAR